MDLLIERKLQECTSHVVDYATLKSILQGLEYENINSKIVQLKRKNIILPLKKGLYIHQSVNNSNLISKEHISNILFDGPSYVSLDYALYFHGLIPERVYEVTAVTTKRSKSFETELGIFSYTQISKELFPIGVNMMQTQNVYFLIAGKEKALCDKIYFTVNKTLTSIKAMAEFLENDLRIDLDDVKMLDTELISMYFEISKSKKINLLYKLISSL